MTANHRPPRRASTPPAILLSLAAGLVVAVILNLVSLTTGTWGEAAREADPDREFPVAVVHALIAIVALVMLCRDAVLWPWAVAEAMP